VSGPRAPSHSAGRIRVIVTVAHPDIAIKCGRGLTTQRKPSMPPVPTHDDQDLFDQVNVFDFQPD
jgi:hypothetical protein